MLDLSTNVVSSGPSLIQKRIWLRLMIVCGKLYAVGGDGNTGANCTPTIEVYNPKKKLWALETSFRSPRRLFSTAATGSKIILFGGKDESYCSLRDCDLYDVVSKSWQSDGLSSVNSSRNSSPNSSPNGSSNNITELASSTQLAGACKNSSAIVIPRENFHGGQAVTISLLRHVY